MSAIFCSFYFSHNLLDVQIDPDPPLLFADQATCLSLYIDWKETQWLKCSQASLALLVPEARRNKNQPGSFKIHCKSRSYRLENTLSPVLQKSQYDASAFVGFFVHD